jgi:hypothetical protein
MSGCLGQTLDVGTGWDAGGGMGIASQSEARDGIAPLGRPLCYALLAGHAAIAAHVRSIGALLCTILWPVPVLHTSALQP